MNRIDLRNEIGDKDMEAILGWTNLRGPEFLHQYAGNTWEFPLTRKQIYDSMKNTYSIFADGVFVGMIQIMKIVGDNAHIGRFIVDPKKVGLGIGTKALDCFCEYLFENFDLHSITLSVYEFNKGAQQCYKKCGFLVDEELLEDGKLPYFRMKKFVELHQLC